MAAGGCSPIIVALPPEMMHESSRFIGAPNVAFVAGGETRQDSVWNALETLSTDRVVIHDGARPVVSVDLLKDVIAALDDADAVVPVLPVDDTLKEVDAESVVATIDRTRFRRVQTPQGFRAGPLREAHTRAREEGFVATDDAQLVERNGGRVVTVEGRFENLKLTRPVDFKIASMYLQS
jgi:2-C-methyl-D-erythritol 4-phosphate cytidylyltransferase